MSSPIGMSNPNHTPQDGVNRFSKFATGQAPQPDLPAQAKTTADQQRELQASQATDAVRVALEDLLKKMANSENDLKFSIDPANNDIVVHVVNHATSEVLREIRLNNLVGFGDEHDALHGVFVMQKA